MCIYSGQGSLGQLDIDKLGVGQSPKTAVYIHKDGDAHSTPFDRCLFTILGPLLTSLSGVPRYNRHGWQTPSTCGYFLSEITLSMAAIMPLTSPTIA